MTDTTTQAALRLIELAKAADQDKREVLDGRRVSVNRPPPFAGGGWSSVCLAMTHEGHGLKAEANAAFIAACDPQTITAICQALQSLTAERDELRAERDRAMEALGDDVAARTMIEDLRMQGGGLEMQFSGGASGLLAQAFVDALDAYAAANYLEVSFDSAKHGRIVVTTQKVAGKTPHQLRKEAEQERDELQAQVEALRADAERYRWLRANWFTMAADYPPGRIQFHTGQQRWSELDESAVDAAIDNARKEGD